MTNGPTRTTRRLGSIALLALALAMSVVPTAVAAGAPADAAEPTPLSDEEMLLLTGGIRRLVCFVQQAAEGCAIGGAIGTIFGGQAGTGCGIGAAVSVLDAAMNGGCR